MTLGVLTNQGVNKQKQMCVWNSIHLFVCLFLCFFLKCVEKCFLLPALVWLRLELNCWNCPFVLSAASTKPNVNLAKEQTFEHTYRKSTQISTQTNVCSFKHTLAFVNSLSQSWPIEMLNFKNLNIQLFAYHFFSWLNFLQVSQPQNVLLTNKNFNLKKKSS